jgi:hypothetical protein
VFIWMLHFYIYVVSVLPGVFHVFQMYVSNVFICLQTYVANVSSACFKSR